MTFQISANTSYKTQSIDTAIAAELVLFGIWRSWNTTQRATHLNYNTYNSRSTAWQLTKTTFPTQNKSQQIYFFLQKVLDRSWIDYLKMLGDIKMIGVFDEALIVADILESLGIEYHVGGSVASGIWGEIRYTQDINLVADVKVSQIDLLSDAFSPRFYISKLAVSEAIAFGNSFNIIDNQTGWKVDIFVLPNDPFQQSRFDRRQQISINELGQTLNFSSPEDTILQKLLWYRLTEQGSEKQWRDILGILKLQQSVLDFTYIQEWADILKLSVDLERALSETNY